MDSGPVLQWTLKGYRREYASVMDVKRFGVMVEDGKNLVVYDRSCFGRDADLSA